MAQLTILNRELIKIMLISDKKVKKGKIKIINYKEGEFFLRVTGYSKGSSFEKVPISIDEIDKGTIEKYSLCKGARLKCSCGDNTSNYNVLPVNKVSKRIYRKFVHILHKLSYCFAKPGYLKLYRFFWLSEFSLDAL